MVTCLSDFRKQPLGVLQCVAGRALELSSGPGETPLDSAFPPPPPPPRGNFSCILQRDDYGHISLSSRDPLTHTGAEGTDFPAPKPPRLPRWGCITGLLIPTGKLEPLVARLMGATMATRVGEGADCLFFGGNAGGGLKIDGEIPSHQQPKQNSLNSYEGTELLVIHY